MSAREPHRFDHLSDGHLADKAAYGDSGAFVALADRFHDQVWTVAALAAADEGTATRATARAFTRTLAGVAAGIGDPDTCVERALVAAAFELAVTARVDEADLVERIPPALRAVDPATRVALWLTTAHGWSEADALTAVTLAPDPAPVLTTVTPVAREAVADLDLHPPSGLATATADAWHEWQGIGLTIPERHPLTTVLARLDAPLGRMGDALGRAGSRTTTRRRRARATAAPATPPPADLLPVGAEPEPEREPEAPAPDRATELAAASGVFLGPRTEGLDLPERRDRPQPRQLATAGSTPTRTRVLAALAAGILTASAVGSLLTTTTTDAPGGRADEVAAGAPAAEGGEGTLLDDSDLVPAAHVTDAADDEAPTSGSPVVGPTSSGAPTGTAGTTRSATRSTSGTGGTTSGAPAAGVPSVGPSGSGGSAGGGTGTGGSAPATAPAPPVTEAPAAPTPTTPPTTTTPPPPTTTPPTTTTPAPGPVCTLLPVLCPGGGLVP